MKDRVSSCTFLSSGGSFSAERHVPAFERCVQRGGGMGRGPDNCHGKRGKQ